MGEGATGRLMPTRSAAAEAVAVRVKSDLIDENAMASTKGPTTTESWLASALTQQALELAERAYFLRLPPRG